MSYSFNSHLSLSKKLKYIVLWVFLIPFLKITAQNCPPQNVVPTTQVNFDESVFFQASQTVNVAQDTNTFTILNGGKATFKAGIDITFYDGFDAFQGSEVNTSLETCSIVNPLIPNDPLFNLQWGHRNTASISSFDGVPNIGVAGRDAKILDAWTVTQGSPSVIVAIIDSGLDIGHPDIDVNRIINQRSFENYDDNNPNVVNTNVNDALGHGTLVTGIIAATANNNIGTAGIDKFCKIMPLKITNDLTQLAPAIRYAVDNQAKVINMSFGRRYRDSNNTIPEYPQQVIDAINYAVSNNVTIIAAAGNDGLGEVDYPSAYPGVISVGAANPCGLIKVPLSGLIRPPYSPGPGNCDRDTRGETNYVGPLETGWGSNYGLELDLLAPGVLLPTTDVTGVLGGYSNNPLSGFYSFTDDGNYILNSFGTSIASPFVCGVVSLMLAVNPNLKPYQVEHILTSSADGNKLVNAFAAVQMAQNFNNSYVLGDWNVSIEAIPTEVNRDSNFNVSVKVKNTGDANLSSKQLKCSLYRDDELIFQNNYTVPSLNVNSHYIVDLNLNPLANNCIRYQNLKFVAEILSGKENEINTFNNKVESSIRLRYILPDLVPIKPEIISNRDYFNIGYRIQNQGSDLASYFGFRVPFVRIWGSQDAFLDANDTIVSDSEIYVTNFLICGNDYMQAVSSNLQYNRNYNYYFIEVDQFNAIKESNENNNIEVVPINTTISDGGPIDLPIDPIPIDPYPIETMRNASNNDLVSFEVFPNPAKDYFSITYDSKMFKKVKIVDVLGTIKFESELNSSNQINIESNTFASGVYMIQLIDKNEGVSIKKVIKN